MELDHRTGELVVNYGDRLVTLMREVRQLTALGFAVPAKILHVSSTAQKFYRHGCILKQVWHFTGMLVSMCSCAHGALLPFTYFLTDAIVFLLFIKKNTHKVACYVSDIDVI